MQIEKLDNELSTVNDMGVLSAYTYSAVISFFAEAMKSNSKPIEIVKKYLELNFGNPVSLMDIMEFYPYSKAKLCRDFSCEYGMSIFEMLTQIRLHHAKILLTFDPHTKLDKIAQACGFNDTSYFCKIYKREFGKSPKSSLI